MTTAPGVGYSALMGMTDQQRVEWERDGVLILPRFFSDQQVAVVLEALARAWRERGHVTVDDLHTNLRMKLRSVDPQSRKDHIFKVNDLYLEFEELRDISLDPRMVEILAELLGARPTLCTTLSLERSTQQEDHIDSLYMTPRTDGHLVATWMALEDVDPAAGPLRYFPGSHKLPLFRFKDGSHHASPEEHPAAIRHITEQCRMNKIEAKMYCPRKGDVLIWHANLVHGGGTIANRSLTRKSMVSHFFSESDCAALGFELVPKNGGHWLYRQHLAIPQPPPPPQTAASTPHEPSPRASPPLRYRMADAINERIKAVLPKRIVESAKTAVAGLLR